MDLWKDQILEEYFVNLHPLKQKKDSQFDMSPQDLPKFVIYSRKRNTFSCRSTLYIFSKQLLGQYILTETKKKTKKNG